MCLGGTSFFFLFTYYFKINLTIIGIQFRLTTMRRWPQSMVELLLLRQEGILVQMADADEVSSGSLAQLVVAGQESRTSLAQVVTAVQESSASLAQLVQLMTDLPRQDLLRTRKSVSVHSASRFKMSSVLCCV